ncbi:MAG: RNA polymerase sigma factor, partial [Isosphaeraceae bacterium]
LYGVAVRTARELKAQKARRLAREGKMNPPRTSAAALLPEDSLDELRLALDEELSRLASPFRGPVVLIDLQGKTHQEAARLLGLPVGTVSSRLVRARDKLRKRLIRRGLSLSAGTIAACCVREASAQSVSPLLVAATSRAAVEYLAGSVAATVVSGSVAALSKGVLKSLWISTLASKAIVIGLVFAASIGTGVGALRLAAQGSAPPFERTVPDDWAWVDELPNAGAATKARLKRCARSALENYAALHHLVYDFNLTCERFFNHGNNEPRTYKTYSYKGKLYWNEGAVRYDFEGQLPPMMDKHGKIVERAKGTYSVLRTRDMAARIEDHMYFGITLMVEKPPKSREEWEYQSFSPLKNLDPWIHYASCFRFEPMSLQEFWGNQRLIESREEGNTITLSFTNAKNPGWLEVICDKSCDSLPVHWKFGDVWNGVKRTMAEVSNEWKKTDGVWYPARYVKIAYIGEEARPTKEYDLRVSNLRANLTAKIPAAVFTLSDLPFPDGYSGLDNRKQPPAPLIRTNGIVRERRLP